MDNLLEPVQIESMIYEIRGQKVMLDRDLAKLYQVETRTLNQAVKRNMKRFPEDFMFQLNSEEYEILMSQFVISSWGGTRKLPYAFTEQGLAMLSGLLNSDIAIMERLERNDEDNLEAINDLSEDMRLEIETIYQAIAALSVKEPSKQEPQRQKIGFKTSKDK